MAWSMAGALSLLGLSACGGASDDDGSGTAGGGGSPSGSGGPGGAGGSGGEGGGASASCHDLPMTSALVAEGSWDASLTLAGFTGHDGLVPGVFDFARDADGALLAVGRFQYIGRRATRPLARLEGDVWRPDPRLSFDTDPPSLGAIATDGQGRIAVATHAELPSSLEEREGEIWVSDGGAFTRAGTFQGAVRRMVWFDGALWVGGLFTLDDLPSAEGLAVLDEQGWQAPPGGAVDGLGVYTLATQGNTLLVGGAFSSVGGIPAASVATYDAGGWRAYDLPGASVYALARDDAGELYAGGLFSVEGSSETGGIARWSGSSWESVGGGLANRVFRGVVSDLAVLDGALHVAGCFSWAGGPPTEAASIQAAGLARWTGQAWEALDEGASPVASGWFAPLRCGDEGPGAVWDMENQRLFADGERLFAGGFFGGKGGVPSHGVIAHEGGGWVAQGEVGQGLSGVPSALAVGGPSCAVHAVGPISHAGSLAVDRRVLRHTGIRWEPVGAPAPAGHDCDRVAVDAAGMPFLGCSRAPVNDGDHATGVVLRSTGDGWETVGDGFGEGGVAALAFDPAGALWVTGGVTQGFVARVEGDGFVRHGAFDGRVNSLAFRPGKRGGPVEAVVGGSFGSVDGVAVRGVARWSGEAWEALGPGLSGSVLAVAYAPDGSIYASTADDGSDDRLILGRWDGAAWSEVATPEPGPVPAGYAFSALLARGNYVIAAGFAWPGSGERNVFAYDGAAFRSVRGGITAISVDQVALAGNGLWFGGSIAEAGPPNGRLPTVGVAHLR
ncbi:uncharacterized protein CMC5_001690 [Chondromyces crocatus]|uniref:Uncharacterized protein n=2 Tax=Chondromyces crocatus TaxID=52 RepID=A0A0K1E5B4_CHOCO|nr:uncharacterized protein CMC5_001690 [Chondromyces crocatus]